MTNASLAPQGSPSRPVSCPDRPEIIGVERCRFGADAETRSDAPDERTIDRSVVGNQDAVSSVQTVMRWQTASRSAERVSGAAGRSTWRGVMAFAVAAFLSACSSSSAPSPVAATAPDRTLPSGWIRYSYGSLSVGAPASWKVSGTPLFCGSPPHTVTESTLYSLTATSCPAMTPQSPRVSAVAIMCLRGKANRADSGPASPVVVNGHMLQRTDDLVSLQGSGSKGEVVLPENFGPSSLAPMILATVAPTGRAC
jgi:hypothetical protein